MTLEDSQTLVFRAPDSLITPGGVSNATFTLWFKDDGLPFPVPQFFWNDFDFALQWEEYLDGTRERIGTIDFVDGVESPAPVPLPTSAWMLVSGLAIFIGIRRQSST